MNDDTSPTTPAVACDHRTVHSWLLQGRAKDYGIDPRGVYTCVDRPSEWIRRLIADLDRGDLPRLWHAPNVRVEVVELLDHTNDRHGGAIVVNGDALLIIDVGGVRLATRPLTAADLTGCTRNPGDPPCALPQLDAAVRALRAAVDAVNRAVDAYQTARRGSLLDHHTGGT